MKNAKIGLRGFAHQVSPERQQRELRLKDRYEGLRHYLELETVETIIENNRDTEHLEPDYWGY